MGLNNYDVIIAIASREKFLVQKNKFLGNFAFFPGLPMTGVSNIPPASQMCPVLGFRAKLLMPGLRTWSALSYVKMAVKW